QFKSACCKTGFEQYCVEQFRHVTVTELHGREVDCKLERRRPRGRFAAGLPQHPFTDLDDQTAFFGDRNEGLRWDKSPLRMLPAQQRLESDDFSTDRRLWLIVQFELALRDR